MKKISLLTIITICIFSTHVFALGGLFATADMETKINPKISVSCGDLNFGTLAYTGAGGSYTVPASGLAGISATNNNNGSLRVVQAGSKATCTIYGPASTSFSINNIEQITEPETNKVTVDTFTNSATNNTVSIGASNSSATFNVGATIHVRSGATGSTTVNQTGKYKVTIGF